MDLIATNILIIKISFYVGIIFLLISTILFTIILINRLIIIHNQKKEAIFTEKWRKTLLDNLYSNDNALESIPKKYNIAFLILWNNLQDVLKGPEKEQLNQLAKELKMDKVAIKMIHSKKMIHQILGMLVVGNLKEESTFQKLKEFTESKNITLGVTALHAMSKINPERTIEPLLSFIKNRNDWPDYKMVMILNELDSVLFSKPLADLIKITPEIDQARLLKLMRFADSNIALDLAKNLLDSSFDSEVLSASLTIFEHFGDSRDIDTIKEYLNNDTPFVRMSAVKVLSSIGSQKILPILETCLSDPDWWVRYRSAEAISKIPNITKENILSIRDRQTDRFAIDILNYVLF